MHEQPKQVEEYGCDSCSDLFTSKHYLRIHVMKKHGNPSNTNPPRSNCEYCGIVLNCQEELRVHQQICNTEFHSANNNICRYFVNGGCLKGDSCIFSHPINSSELPPTVEMAYGVPIWQMVSANFSTEVMGYKSQTKDNKPRMRIFGVNILTSVAGFRSARITIMKRIFPS